MPAAPLTHHDILELAEPFTRRGRHVDLAASRRAERALSFKPVSMPLPDRPPLQERLELQVDESGELQLTRTLHDASGLVATLQARGRDAGALLARLASVAPASQVEHGAHHVLARNLVFDDADGDAAPRLHEATVRVAGLSLHLQLPATRGLPAEWRLRPDEDGARPDLPEDLLAVLGWDWSRLLEQESGWAARLRLRGGAARRQRLAEAALRRVAAHLADVTGAPPQRFHERHRLARWGVFLRRLIPSITAVGLIVGALLLPRWVGQENSGLMMALHYVPIAILALSFTLQDYPRFEIPPWPRRPKARHWQPEGAD